MNQELSEQIHYVIDGVATADERSIVETARATSAEAHELFEELSALSATLDVLVVEEPPPAFVPQVMNRLRKSQTPAVAPGRSASRFDRRKALFAGWAIAATLAIAFGLHSTLRPTSAVASADVSGAMVAPVKTGFPVTITSWPIVARASLPAPNATTLTVRRSGDLLAAFAEPGTATGDVSFRWNRDKLQLITISSGQQATVTDAGQVTLSPAAARSGLIFRRRAAVTGPAEIAMVVAGSGSISTSVDLK